MAEYKALAPDVRAFGQYSPEYARYLGTSTGDQSLDLGNSMVLGHLAQGEGPAYLAALKDANMSQLQGQAGNNQTDITGHAIDQLANATNAGVGPALTAYLPGADTRSVLPASAVHLDKTAGEGYLSRAQGLKALAEAGFAPTTEDVSNTMTGPLDTKATPYLQYATPHDVTEGRNADAAGVRAAALDFAAHNPKGRGGIGADGVTIEGDSSLIGPQFKVKGHSLDAVLTALANAANHNNGTQGATGKRTIKHDAHGKLIRQ